MKALLNALRGLKQTWIHEKAFRFEIIGYVSILSFVTWYDASRIDKLFVVFSLTLVLVMELVNTAIEKASDAFKKSPDPLIQFSKDAASAAVFISLLLAGVSLMNLGLG